MNNVEETEIKMKKKTRETDCVRIKKMDVGYRCGRRKEDPSHPD
jgi:hypothetical protein